MSPLVMTLPARNFKFLNKGHSKERETIDIAKKNLRVTSRNRFQERLSSIGELGKRIGVSAYRRVGICKASSAS